MPDVVLWLRRDLRLGDHPALLAAAEQADGGRVLPLFVLDPALLGPAGTARTVWLLRSLRAWDASAGGALVVRSGRPQDVVAQVARELGAAAVHATADAGPYGRERDERVRAALAGDDVPLVRTGTPYAVGPGTVTKGDGSPYAVFTPFSRAWREHGWPSPASTPPPGLRWARSVDGDGVPDEPSSEVDLPDVGEEAALRRWREFCEHDLDDYADARDRPDLPGTSRMSAHLKYGEVHPRTLLADLAGRRSQGARTYRTELAWREFYADVLWHHPESAREYLRPQLAGMRYDAPGERFDAWCRGETGFPFVDAGMRQLLREGWVHNRVRMVVASFLVKDLHVEWQHGARYFLRHLRDGDLASNNHGWQWVAGSGTDAAPYFRVFNPVTQGTRFDPDGEYVRRYVPELRHLPGRAAHTPWDADGGYDRGYPERVVDHAAEREEALARYQEVRG
ncbi:cryptochrome/photolyase family protein [Thalassiella azotivora]